MPVSNPLITILPIICVCGTLLAPASAAEQKPLLERNLFSIGAGFSDNEISSPDEDDTGFQFSAAYDLNQVKLMEGINSSIEFGFMDFGFDDDDTGIWGSYVVDGTLSGRLGWLAQGGFDIGDDSGLLLGAGLKVMLNDKADFRFEYVVRDEVDSLLFNFMYHL